MSAGGNVRCKKYGVMFQGEEWWMFRGWKSDSKIQYKISIISIKSILLYWNEDVNATMPKIR